MNILAQKCLVNGNSDLQGEDRGKGKRVGSVWSPSLSDPDSLSAAGPRVEVEYEQEIESFPLKKSALESW